MKIALVSFEYPPDTAFGGIATYNYQIANMLKQREHYVEVFAGSLHRSTTETDSNSVIVHRVQVKKKVDFIRAVAQVFNERHRIVSFDVLEGPEYGADAVATVQAVPDIPLVVKLHTPRVIVEDYEGKEGALAQLRTKIGALRRGINPFRDIERTHTLEADEIAAPSMAIGEEVIKRWGVDSKRVHQFPLPYSPPAELLSIPVETTTNMVTFIGRLEVKKGVLDFAQAIPLILENYPDAKFRFVGRHGDSPDPNRDMRNYIEDSLGSCLQNVEFTGQVAPDQIPAVLANTDVCVFPSQWESFGLVCLEAMAAGRGVVGSSAGGMAEIINSHEVGRLVPPKSPQSIARAVVELLNDPVLRYRLGAAARKRVLCEYNIDRVGDLQEESYQRAINRRQALGLRSPRLLL
jgi:glycosyltransferase involved in cell wall biosynthesis